MIFPCLKLYSLYGLVLSIFLACVPTRYPSYLVPGNEPMPPPSFKWNKIDLHTNDTIIYIPDNVDTMSAHRLISRNRENSFKHSKYEICHGSINNMSSEISCVRFAHSCGYLEQIRRKYLFYLPHSFFQ